MPSKARNELGQFKETTRSTRYKQARYLGKPMQEHQKVLCEILGIKSIPYGIVVHHIDENKKNNCKDNLALLTITAHNRLHRHQAWNKGIRAVDNFQWAETIKKGQLNRKKYFFPIFKETMELKKSGKKLREIAEIQGVSRRQVSDRLNSYEKYVKILQQER